MEKTTRIWTKIDRTSKKLMIECGNFKKITEDE